MLAPCSQLILATPHHPIDDEKSTVTLPFEHMAEWISESHLCDTTTFKRPKKQTLVPGCSGQLDNPKRANRSTCFVVGCNRQEARTCKLRVESHPLQAHAANHIDCRSFLQLSRKGYVLNVWLTAQRKLGNVSLRSIAAHSHMESMNDPTVVPA